MIIHAQLVFFFHFTLAMSRNSHLEAENKRLSSKVDEMKEICSLTSSLNVKYKVQLDREVTDRRNLQESNQRLKIKLNSLTVKCTELNQKVKVLDAHLRRRPITRISNQPQVRVISLVSDIRINEPQSSEALKELQKRYDELDVAHQEALNVIDELDFELDDVIIESSLVDIHTIRYILHTFLSFISCLVNFRSITLKWKLKDCNKKTQK